MKEGHPSPKEYHNSQENLQIPKDLQMTDGTIGKLLSSENESEPEKDITNLYLNPHYIAEKIRALKKEYYNPDISPGAEGKMEIEEKYIKLRQQRENIKELILKNLSEKNSDPEELLQNTKKRRKNFQNDFENAQRKGNDIALKQAEDKWHIANDFIQLLENDMKGLTLEQEDEGLELERLKDQPI